MAFRSLDGELSHLDPQGPRIHSKELSSPFGVFYFPLGFLERSQDVLPLNPGEVREYT